MQKTELFLKALADQNRLRMVALLAKQKLCVCELAEVLGITQPSVSKHLKKLKEAGIISSEQDGLWTNYFLHEKQDKMHSEILEVLVSQLLKTSQSKSDQKLSQKSDREKICCKSS